MVMQNEFDLYPFQSQFTSGQTVKLMLDLPGDCPDDNVIDIEVFHHYQSVQTDHLSAKQIRAAGGVIDIGSFADGGYRVIAKLHSASNVMTARTAFDVKKHWREAPRYGFLCDFQPRESFGEIQTFFRKFHLNVVQYYDWMERHDALVPNTPEFVDPMGRTLTTNAILSRIQAMKEIGSASIAYAAVYASLPDYAKAHPEEGLYDNQGVQYNLIDIFHLMDITEGSPWRDHILAEFIRVIDFGFDGLHLDQYGFPKSAKRMDGSALWMDDAYVSFINACRERLGDKAGLIFNAVSSYPVHSVCEAEQDAVYVEVWPPMTRYRHLLELVTRIRSSVNGRKQVILAAYLKSFREKRDANPEAVVRSALLVTAVIFVSGGYHLVLGESAGMLAEPYYPDYVPMVPELGHSLRAMYDIVTADADLISSPDTVDVSWSFVGGINDQILIEGAPISVEPEAKHIWVRVTTTKRGLVIHLVNLLWIAHEDWNAIHDETFSPTPPLHVSIEWNHTMDGVWIQRAKEAIWHPEDWSWKPHVRGEAICVTVPSFDVWTMIFVPYGAAEANGTGISERG